MLIGNIGKDPTISASSTGRKRISFSLATSRRYRDNNGELKEQTDWHNIVGWGKIVDTMEQLGIRKGMTLYIEGTLTNRSWTDKTTNQKRTLSEVSLDSFQLLTPRNQNGGVNPYASNQSPAERQMGVQEEAIYANQEDDLPF